MKHCRRGLLTFKGWPYHLKPIIKKLFTPGQIFKNMLQFFPFGRKELKKLSFTMPLKGAEN